MTTDTITAPEPVADPTEDLDVFYGMDAEEAIEYLITEYFFDIQGLALAMRKMLATRAGMNTVHRMFYKELYGHEYFQA